MTGANVLGERAAPQPTARPSTRRRMLVFAHGYPPLQASGAELHIARKVEWWHAHGHQVEVVAVDPQPSASMAPDIIDYSVDSRHGVPVHRLRLAVPDASRPVRDTFAHPGLIPQIRARLEAFEPDIVYQISGYILGLWPLQLASANGIPTVLFAADYWAECQRVTLLRPDGSLCLGARSAADCAACRLTAQRAAAMGGRRLNKLLWHGAAAVGHRAPGALADRLGVTVFSERQAAIAEALTRIDRVVVNSSFLAERLVRLGVTRERMLVIRQGIDASEFAGIRTPTDLSATGLRVIYLGQLSRHKGVDLLIDAVTRLADAGERISVDLHGPVTDQAIAATLQALDHPAINVGRLIPREEVAAELIAHDVLVLPSRWYDNSPNVILEAFSTGLPVVAANHGGMAGMVRHDVDGLLFQPGDAQALADTLRRLAREPGLLERLREGICPPYDLDGEMEPEEPLLDALLAASGR